MININRDSITHWTMIWEEEGHHIFINHEMKYKYTLSSSWALHETLIWFCYVSSPRNSSSKLCNTRGWSLGKRCGQRELQSLQRDNAKVQVSYHGPPYLYLYALWRDRVKDKVVTTKGVSCITTKTTQNSRNIHFFTCIGQTHGLQWQQSRMKAEKSVFSSKSCEYMSNCEKNEGKFVSTEVKLTGTM